MQEKGIILTQYGYLLLLTIFLVIGVDFSFGFYLRILIALMFLSLFFQKQGIKRFYRPIEIVFIIFTIVYSIRFIFDVFFKDVVVLGYTKSYIINYFFLLIILPITAIISNRKRPNIKKFISYLWIFTILANIFSVAYFLVNGLDIEFIYSSRAEVRSEDGNSTILNPITIGHLGVSLLLQVIWRFKNTNSLLILLLVPFGIINLIISASRGPVIVLLIILFLIIIRKVISNNRNWIMILIGILFTYYFVINKYQNDIYIIERILSTTESYGEESRFTIWNCALNDFLNNPIFGNSIITCGGNYPHNIFLEILMSTGFVGFILFIILFSYLIFKISKKIIFSNFNNEGYINVWWLAIFLSSLTSGSLFFNPLLWISTIYILKNE